MRSPFTLTKFQVKLSLTRRLSPTETEEREGSGAEGERKKFTAKCSFNRNKCSLRSRVLSPSVNVLVQVYSQNIFPSEKSQIKCEIEEHPLKESSTKAAAVFRRTTGTYHSRIAEPPNLKSSTILLASRKHLLGDQLGSGLLSWLVRVQFEIEQQIHK